MSETQQLKPCPFCGGKPFLMGPSHTDEGDSYQVICGDCGGMTEEHEIGDVVAAWNRRVVRAITLTVGTKGHVVGLGYRVAAQIVEVAPASVRVSWDTPDGRGHRAWFSTSPGVRYLRRHGDTSEAALRFELGGDET